MLNYVTIDGRLGDNVKILGDDVKVARFSIAHNKSWKNKETGEWETTTSWIPVVSFQGKYIEAIKEKLVKGAHVIVHGELRQYDYTNKEGLRRMGIEVVIGHSGKISILPSHGKEETPDVPEPAKDHAPPASDYSSEAKADPNAGSNAPE